MGDLAYNSAVNPFTIRAIIIAIRSFSQGASARRPAGQSDVRGSEFKAEFHDQTFGLFEDGLVRMIQKICYGLAGLGIAFLVIVTFLNVLSSLLKF
jgi:hypothetical protein